MFIHGTRDRSLQLKVSPSSLVLSSDMTRILVNELYVSKRLGLFTAGTAVLFVASGAQGGFGIRLGMGLSPDPDFVFEGINPKFESTPTYVQSGRAHHVVVDVLRHLGQIKPRFTTNAGTRAASKPKLLKGLLRRDSPRGHFDLELLSLQLLDDVVWWGLLIIEEQVTQL